MGEKKDLHWAPPEIHVDKLAPGLHIPSAIMAGCGEIFPAGERGNFTSFRGNITCDECREVFDAHRLANPPMDTTEVRSTSATGGQKGVKAERYDLIPTGPLRELALHYGVGAQKYAPHQWRMGIDWEKLYAALQRHANAWQGGEDYDVCPPDEKGCKFEDMDGNPVPTVSLPQGRTCFNHTGSHHMVAVAWQAFALLEMKDTHPELDDRYKESE